MSVRKIYKIQVLLFFIFLLNDFSLKSVYVISVKCNQKLYLTGCPFYAKCNKAKGLCECKAEYPIHLSEHIPCLDYRKLGQKCIHSSQCIKTSSAICYNTNFDQMNDTLIFKKKFYGKIIKKDYEYGFEYSGECKCKVCHNSCLNHFIFRQKYFLLWIDF